MKLVQMVMTVPPHYSKITPRYTSNHNMHTPSPTFSIKSFNVITSLLISLPLQMNFLPFFFSKYPLYIHLAPFQHSHAVRLLSSAVYLSPVDDVHFKILEHLVVCERVVGGRAAMQCDHLVIVLPGSLYFHRLQTTLLCIDFAHTPS